MPWSGPFHVRPGRPGSRPRARGPAHKAEPQPNALLLRTAFKRSHECERGTHECVRHTHQQIFAKRGGARTPLIDIRPRFTLGGIFMPAKTKTIPEGYHSITPYLTLN